MRVISRRKLIEFCAEHKDAKEALDAWFHEARHASWKNPEEIKQRYHTVDILPGNRAVFNIKGNHYRLVVSINYSRGIIYIRFVGTHALYNSIDAETI